MKESTPGVIRREDYRPPPYTIAQIELNFELDEHATRVTAESQVARTEAGAVDAPLVLDGQNMVLVSVAIDGRVLGESDYTLTPEALIIPGVPARFRGMRAYCGWAPGVRRRSSPLTSTAPGAIAFTRMPSSANSTAACLVSITSAPLLVA